MQNSSNLRMEAVFQLFQNLDAKEKEQFYQLISSERQVPQWQIELVRSRKKAIEAGDESLMTEEKFLKLIG